ncbi:MAG: hypothetical protein MZU95_15790, partial [Desulfomicrobium escambiense]|nr:hypothetical protein [Desulfomicrobium escambiense]
MSAFGGTEPPGPPACPPSGRPRPRGRPPRPCGPARPGCARRRALAGNPRHRIGAVDSVCSHLFNLSNARN